MKSPIKIALSWFTRKFQEMTGELPKAIQEELNKEVSPQKAVNDTFKKQGIFGKLRQRMTEVIEKAAEIGFGKKPPKMPELFEAWDASKMNLSEKLHGADIEMRKSIINAIKEQLKLGNRAQKSALALYDGYNSGKRVIRTQELPIYLKSIVNFARRGNLSDKDKEQLQRLIRNARRQVEKLGENGAPNKALKAAYSELLQAVENGKEKALERGIKTAVEEKSRYVAERIARTETARAWADAFIARYENDKDVVAYKWQLSSRHPHFDVCDMYANANLYNLGKGIFPKDKCPTLPVHPHCLCHLTPIFKNEVDITKQKDRLKEGGAEWIKSLTNGERVKLLGINGALQFKNGGDFLLSLRGYSGEVMGTRLKNVVTDEGNSGKMGLKGGVSMGAVEQAKKRDHKIMITDIAIDKVPYVKIPGLSDDACKAIQEEHKEILRIAKEKNNSNEILSLMSKNLNEKSVRVLGGEFGVDPSTDPKAVSLFNCSGRQEIMYLHNHPSTNRFSMTDIMTFIAYGEIGTISVVTNQGEVHVLNKTSKYDFEKSGKILKKIYEDYQSNKISHNLAVKEFLKVCDKGGIVYARSD